MKAIDFNGSNLQYKAPEGLTKEQVANISAYVGVIERGSCEGLQVVVTAWLPTPDERETIANGGPVFFSCLGGLPAHFLTTSFQQAKNPA